VACSPSRAAARASSRSSSRSLARSLQRKAGTRTKPASAASSAQSVSTASSASRPARTTSCAPLSPKRETSVRSGTSGTAVRWALVCALAARDTRWRSSTMTDSPARRRSSPAVSPVSPAPTMATSALRSPSSAGKRSPGISSSHTGR
jgi:hypothetical protein